MLNFNLVSPERELASRQVEYVVLPGAEGDMAVYENHAPVMTTLRPGIIQIAAGESYVVFGGFADVTPPASRCWPRRPSRWMPSTTARSTG